MCCLCRVDVCHRHNSGQKDSYQDSPLPPNKKPTCWSVSVGRDVLDTPLNIRFATDGWVRCALQSVNRYGGARHIVRAPDFIVPKRYRAFWSASTNLFAERQKRVLIRITLSHAKQKTSPFGLVLVWWERVDSNHRS